MKKTILITALSVLAMLAVGVSVFAGGKQETAPAVKSTINWVNWVSVEEGTRNRIKEVITEFERVNPNIHVRVIPVPVSEKQNQLSIMIAGKNTPDMSQVHPDDVVTFAAMGALAPVMPLLSEDFKKDVHQSLFDLTKYEGTHYGIPWAPAGPGFLYNKKLMAQAGLDPNKPPKTVDEMTEYMRIAKEKLPPDTVMMQLDTTIRTIGLLHQWPFIRAFGALPVDGRQAKVNSPEMIAYTEWVRSLMKKEYTLPGRKYGEFRPMAAQGRLLFAFDGSYLKGIITSLNKSVTEQMFFDTWGVAPIPAGKQGVHFAAPDDHFLVIFKDSQIKEAAAKFAEYLVNSEYSLKTYISPVGFVPAAKSAMTRVPELGTDPVRKSFSEKIIPTVVPLPYGPDYTKIATTITAAIQEAITTDKQIPQILNDAQGKVEEILKKK
jgi:multiple sugar transport system substrate-binding protein